ncbi:substrate-binding domain-containing protein [Vibrio natriegens]|uniref:DNA-binding transcriptional regulator GalS n=1 Tax=Vibrio natriegens NBRC 15636 = ATCC 14048 = DSM 759 TaxID=1219067 RepID=A0AAN0Y3X0_VIBNA|nr:substrate-binding domain-containing protein [Vibrio natriegens]ALR14790.1 transcriptional regulator [Vibrio natriegens NBRC 15636 = ATCC 14048 = DSM 759]ANQ13346.1 DNA-binding transcriptional regulator GalS [Vibrio natriegens NBRC 15636 = ATCC 14048 = DSM 759]EPM40933.1 transcriptional regulator [Vibrio natriegens NBRC 15636 = ATCC 14048 = DSM 759]MDX6027781.1 substrate-binding domain-containing protein [Vibrio natriegens NBRC 15636 = ATCC 14048 = DSM 759]UUI11088.1 substrate-binding domain
MATIKDVAKEAGVSVATVSRVINKSPKASQNSIDAVTQAMSKLGYRPNAAARALVSQSTNTIGVLVSDVSDPFFGTLVKSVDNVARENGKHILIGNGYHNADDERRALDLLANSRCDALVIHAKGLSDEELIAYAKEVKGLVLINRHIPVLAERCISLDNRKGAFLATEYLIRHGHRKIACIASSHDIEDTDERLQGYQSALKEHGIELSKSYVEYGEPNSDGGEVAMTNLLTKSLEITGVVAYNDYMAAGALATLEQNGIDVPQQVSMVGFDDGLIARFVHPGLTTIRYPIEIMAERATRLALALSRNEKVEDETIIFSPTLVRRDSVAKV